MDINPLSIKAIWLRGTIYFDLKEYEKAINDFNFVIKSDTNDYEKLLKYESLDLVSFIRFHKNGLPPKGTLERSFPKVDGLNFFIMALEKRGISKFFLEDYGGAVRDLLFIDKMHGISPSSNKTLAMSLFETNLYGA